MKVQPLRAAKTPSSVRKVSYALTMSVSFIGLSVIATEARAQELMEAPARGMVEMGAPDLSAWGGACPVGMVAVAENVCSTDADVAYVPPPKPGEWHKYTKCLAKWFPARKIGQATDAGMSTALVATGAATELNPLGWGVLPVKLIYNTWADGRTRKLVYAGRYDEACRLNKAGAIFSLGFLGVIF